MRMDSIAVGQSPVISAPSDSPGMMTTGERDRLVGLIYDGVFDDDAWRLALAQVADLVGAPGVGLGMQDMKTHAFRNLGAVGISPDLNPTYQRLAPENRIWQEIARRRRPLTDRMVMPKAALMRTELYADWFRPQGFHCVMAHPALFRNDASVVIAALRSRRLGDFEPADLARLGLFAEHFGRAIGIRLDREQAEADLAAAKRALDALEDAILIVDRACRIQHANAAARVMLDAGQMVRLYKGRLEIQAPEADQRLMRIVAQGRGGELSLAGPGARGLMIRIHPSVDGLSPHGGGATMVRIIDPNREREPLTPARLRDRLGLTLRQAEVVAALAAGVTEAEAARNLKLGEPTLHTHVRRVYDRLDLRSRGELLALLARHGFHIPQK
jgi:DNA-binding CsgD family transcriptional regulator/PAS domain-containing protein